jgi:hypothetical protein
VSARVWEPIDRLAAMTQATAPEATMQLEYDGSALADNRMDVRDIAPAMLAMADAIRSASQLLYPEQVEPRVEIQATAPGSFIVHLLVSEASLLHRATVGLFSSPDFTAGANLTGVVGGVVVAIKTLARLTRHRIRDVQPVFEPGQPAAVRITLTDGTVLEISEQAWRLMQDMNVRIGLRNVVEPLNRDGITTLDASAVSLTAHVDRADIAGFDIPPTPDEPISDVSREVALKLASVAFVTGNKWRLTDGDATFHATIADLDFLNRVERGEEMFSRRDILRALLRTQQWRTDSGGLRVEHTVVKVEEHIHGPRDVPLPFERPPEGE